MTRARWWAATCVLALQPDAPYLELLTLLETNSEGGGIDGLEIDSGSGGWEYTLMVAGSSCRVATTSAATAVGESVLAS